MGSPIMFKHFAEVILELCVNKFMKDVHYLYFTQYMSHYSYHTITNPSPEAHATE